MNNNDRKITNGDVIRSMTDAELVDYGYVECPKIYRNCDKKTCRECKIEYLRAEAWEK